MKMKHKSTALLVLGVLALSACGQQPQPQAPATPPAQGTQKLEKVRALGLYELQINGLGTQQAQASVRQAGSLSAQASEVQGLTYTFQSMSNVGDAAKQVMHMTATFKVTNTSATPIQVPVFIPVDTDGSHATDGETPFRNVTTSTGIAVSPAGMEVEQSHRTSGGLIEIDPSATPLVENLDTGALEVALPGGTTLPGISHRGWRGEALAPGASITVNFAARVPMKKSELTPEDPFRFNLVFAVADNPGTVALTNIASVQGSTPAGNAASPLNSQSATVEGVVTSVLPGLSGFFVQEEGIDADKDANTSNGVFVYCGASCPTIAANSRVRVTGTVSEYNGATQLTNPAVTVLSAGVPSPAAVSLTLPLDKTQQEKYEGMRVTFPEMLTVTNNYTYGRYGQLDLSNGGRVFNPTNGNAKTGQSTITLDDGILAQNPGTLNFLSSENTRRTGDTVTGLSGVWHTIANTPMLEPEGPVNFVSANSRAANALPKDVGGSLKVGGANVLNYFTTYGSTTDRGANNAGELARQRAKMVTNLVTLNADVLTLMEIQNNGDTAVDDLVAALNEKAGAGTYAAVKTGKVGTDAIKVAIIYQPAKVTPIGAPMIDNNSVFSRPPVAQTFRDKATNGVFSVVANHFKSKGSCPTSGDTDQGQGCWNLKRVDQANALLNFVSTIKQKSGDQDVLITGDLNAYGAEDPIKALQNGGFESLNLRIPAEDRYSYQFNGQFGYLDHALASQNLSGQVTGITEWHVNSDEPVIADYNVEFKNAPGCTSTSCTGIDLFDASHPFRASDHDPVLVGLNLTADAGTTPVNPVTTLTASPAALTVTAGGAAVSSTLTTSTQNYSGADLTVTITTPAGVTVTPSATTVSPNGTFTVSVTAPEGTPAGTYPVTVTTTGDNGLKASTDLTVTLGTGGGTTPPTPTGSDLIFSEYVEGSSNNKALELYNPTSDTIDLSAYSVELYANGATTPNNTQKLSGTLAAGGTLVLVNGQAGATLKALGTVSSVTNFNGDDALVLKKGTTIIDSFGQVGLDPGNAWTANGVTTIDKTLRRKAGVTAGDANATDAFDPSAQWEQFNIDTFDGLGSR
ncbi:ExeM/NucH family extracellular endonuclease [Deinococcus wulumuqiensis]|uniref:Nuclease n=1 Tax=Deinococcus wulumuqiensis TaxID=980427 RepID=A0AAV4K473_9DEIO|nr:ExeM/NucH family extracellular endonuclease [Deinococcus wulumuqiensis]QII20162.1 ExeM/NucH family extracellular endonuclease [Deinococcus wulumuqiensis R12]GGI75552.1 nuclease [Deinococcus wulumuqiensis]GGP28740.1 nuclease [Deinococcus wulumuqiensis]